RRHGRGPGAGQPGSGLPDRRHGDRQRQRARRRRCRRGHSCGGGVIPIADTNVVEATWVLVVKSVVIFAVAFMIIPMLTLMERKLLGRFQARYGPNRVGPYGLLQPAADAVKLLSKEGFRPARAVPILSDIAPALVVLSAGGKRAVIPLGARQKDARAL